jgi:hypothetical protein
MAGLSRKNNPYLIQKNSRDNHYNQRTTAAGEDEVVENGAGAQEEDNELVLATVETD